MLSQKARRQALVLVALFVGVAGALLGRFPGVPVAFAAESATESLVYGVSTLVSMAITFMNVMMWVLFRLLAIVLDPNLIFDVRENGTSPLYEMLRGIWQFSRDLVNVGFAFMLVYGAVMTIVKASSDFVKNYARNFVIAVVAVNFSWFVPQVIFDVSQIAAATIYQIPSLLDNAVDCQIPSERDPAALKPCEIVTKVVFFENAEPISDQLNAIVGPIDPDNPPNGWRCPLEGVVCYQYTPITDQNINIRPDLKVINGLVINHARLRTLASVVQPPPGNLAGDDLKAMKELLVYLMKLMLVLALHIALFFPVLAMTFAFFIRIPILWLTMAFMPFVFLEFVMGGKFFKQFSPMEKIWNGFLGAVFLPVMVAIPFTIGFIILNAFGSITDPPQALRDINEAIPLFVGVGDLWQLLWLGLALGILWTQVFAAIGSFSAAKGITSKIQGFGEGVGKMAVQAPLNVPLPGVGVSVAEMGRITNPKRWIGAQGSTIEERLKHVRGRADPDQRQVADNTISDADLQNSAVQDQIKLIANPATNLSSNEAKTALNQIVTELKRMHADELRNVNGSAILESIVNRTDALRQIDPTAQARMQTAMNPAPVAPATPPAPPAPPTPPAPPAPGGTGTTP